LKISVAWWILNEVSFSQQPQRNEMFHRVVEVAGTYEHSSEASGYIKGGEFLD
jgi:hypothetical protein